MAAAGLPAGPHPSASLYVGDLVPDVTEAQLFEIFNAVGPVASVRVCRDAATRRSLGYAYVNFHRVEDAERALDTMNFKTIKTRPCRIMWSHRDPSLRKSGIGNIFVKNLHTTIDNKSLYDTFSMFGNILSCKVAQNSKRVSLGYGFVHYESKEASQSAIDRVNGKVIAGQKVTVSRFLSRNQRYPGGAGNSNFTNLFLKNLPADFTKEKLDTMCSEFGNITSSMLAMKDGGEGSKGFGFVNFDTAESAAACVEALHGKDLGDKDKPLFVSRAQKREERDKELKERFEHAKRERQRQYAGVNVYIKNLADDIDDNRLRDEFKQFGQITSCHVMMDQADPPKSRGFGFVCFSANDEATKAVTEMHGHMLDGKPLYVALAQRKEVRRAQLEAQHAARKASNLVGPQPMYPPGAPILYQSAYGGMPRQNYMYPNQMGGRMPYAGGVQQQMMLRGGQPPQGPYQMIPVAAAGGGRGGGQQGAGGQPRRGGPGGRGGRTGKPQGGGRGGGAPRGQQQQQQQQSGYKFADNAQNTQQERRQAPPQAAPEPQDGEGALTIQALAAAPDEQKKQMIGERLFPLVQRAEPNLAGKITGMLLEMDNGELIHLLENSEALDEKIREAMEVLRNHEGDE